MQKIFTDKLKTYWGAKVFWGIFLILFSLILIYPFLGQAADTTTTTTTGDNGTTGNNTTTTTTTGDNGSSGSGTTTTTTTGDNGSNGSTTTTTNSGGEISWPGNSTTTTTDDGGGVNGSGNATTTTSGGAGVNGTGSTITTTPGGGGVNGSEISTVSADTVNPTPDVKNPLAANIEQVKAVWKISLQFVDYIVVAFLIFIAFVNMLRINIDTYAIKKTLPSLILGIILANFSWWICKMFIELSSAVVGWFQDQSGGSVLLSIYKSLFVDVINAVTGGNNPSAKPALLGLFAELIGLSIPGSLLVAFVVGLIVAAIPLVLFLVTYLLLFIRVYVIYFLIIVSPLAFIAMGLSFTTKLFQQWWDQFIKWVFLAPVAIFLWFMAAQIAKLGAGGAGGVPQFTRYVLICAALYFALKVPFSLGGGLVAPLGGFLSGLGKKSALHAGRTADQKFGKTFGWSPAGMVDGWQKDSERKWQEHMTKTSVKGQDFRQGLTSMPGQIGKIYQELKSGKDVKSKLWKTDERGVQAQLEQSMQKAKTLASDRTNSKEDLEDMHAEAIIGNDHQEAREIFLARAMRGELSTDDINKHFEKFDKLFQKTNGQEITSDSHKLLARANGLARENAKDIGDDGLSIVVPTYATGKDGHIRQLSEKESSDEGLKDLIHNFNSDKSVRPQLLSNAASILTATDIADFKPEHLAAARFLDNMTSSELGKSEIGKLGTGVQQQIANLKDKLNYASNFADPSLNIPASELQNKQNNYVERFGRNDFSAGSLSNEDQFVMFHNAEKIRDASAKEKLKATAGSHFAGLDSAKKADLDKILEDQYDSSGEMEITKETKLKIKDKLKITNDAYIDANAAKFNTDAQQIKSAIESKFSKLKELGKSIPDISLGKIKIETKADAEAMINIKAAAGILSTGLDQTFKHKLDGAVEGLDSQVQKIIKGAVGKDMKFDAKIKGSVIATVQKTTGIKVNMNDLSNRLNTLEKSSGFIEQQRNIVKASQDQKNIAIIQKKLKEPAVSVQGVVMGANKPIKSLQGIDTAAAALNKLNKWQNPFK